MKNGGGRCIMAGPRRPLLAKTLHKKTPQVTITVTMGDYFNLPVICIVRHYLRFSLQRP